MRPSPASGPGSATARASGASNRPSPRSPARVSSSVNGLGTPLSGAVSRTKVALSPGASVNSPWTPSSPRSRAPPRRPARASARACEDGAVLVHARSRAARGRSRSGARPRRGSACSPRTQRRGGQPLAVVEPRGDRHEVLHLADPVRRQEAGDQDVRVREVELLDRADRRARARPGSGRRFCRSRIAAKTLGESKRGQQYQSIVPSVPTSATVRRSPMTPCSAIGRYSRRSRERQVDRPREGAILDLRHPRPSCRSAEPGPSSPRSLPGAGAVGDSGGA